MKIAIRVDATVQIGSGRFMRCLTLADELSQRGARVQFVSRSLLAPLEDMLSARGHGLALVDGDPIVPASTGLAHSHWLGTEQVADAQETLGALADHFWDWLIVDHYALDARWESELRRSTRNILVIDDIADRRHDCDVLLDQNYHLDMDLRYAGKVPASCRKLLGPRYALLREEFRKMRGTVTPRTGAVGRALVFFGGVDSHDCTGRAIQALANIGEGMHVDVVIGAQHPHRERIESTCAEHRFDCHVQTSRMAQLMASADLSFGAGGSAVWERCCMALPALTVSVAENQVAIAKGIASLGAGSYLGSQETASYSVMREAFLELSRNAEQVRMLSEHAYSLVDGLGVSRVCDALVD